MFVLFQLVSPSPADPSAGGRRRPPGGWDQRANCRSSPTGSTFAASTSPKMKPPRSKHTVATSARRWELVKRYVSHVLLVPPSPPSLLVFLDPLPGRIRALAIGTTRRAGRELAFWGWSSDLAEEQVTLRPWVALHLLLSYTTLPRCGSWLISSRTSSPGRDRTEASEGSAPCTSPRVASLLPVPSPRLTPLPTHRPAYSSLQLSPIRDHSSSRKASSASVQKPRVKLSKGDLADGAGGRAASLRLGRWDTLDGAAFVLSVTAEEALTGCLGETEQGGAAMALQRWPGSW